MLYKTLGLQIPKDVRESMVNNGAAFFDYLAKNKANKFEVKGMNSTLGFLETGLIRTAENPGNVESNKFTGEGLEKKVESRKKQELLSEIDRLNDEVEN